MLRKIKQVAGHSGPGRKNLILLHYFVKELNFSGGEAPGIPIFTYVQNSQYLII